jgi:predicted HTH domain antitoxin
MVTVEVPVDERLLLAAGWSQAEAKHELGLILAAKLYDLRRITLAQGAEMAGLSLEDFMQAVSRLGVSVINLTLDELAAELRA